MLKYDCDSEVEVGVGLFFVVTQTNWSGRDEAVEEDDEKMAMRREKGRGVEGFL